MNSEPLETWEEGVDGTVCFPRGPTGPSVDDDLVVMRLGEIPSEVARARAVVGAALLAVRMLPDDRNDTLLIVSELVSNAVIHGRAPRWLRLRLNGGRLDIVVGDGAAKFPFVRRPHGRRTGGRGMLVVERLCESWGVDTRHDGKEVWCSRMLRSGS